MADLETFCKLKIAEAKRDLRSYKKASTFDMEISHKRAFALGVVSAFSKMLVRIKQTKKETK